MESGEKALEAKGLIELVFKRKLFIIFFTLFGLILALVYTSTRDVVYHGSIKFPYSTYGLHYNKVHQDSDYEVIVPLSKNLVEVIIRSTDRVALQAKIKKEIAKIKKIYIDYHKGLLEQIDEEVAGFEKTVFTFAPSSETEKLWRENALLEFKILYALIHFDRVGSSRVPTLREVLEVFPMIVGGASATKHVIKWEYEKNKKLYEAVVDKYYKKILIGDHLDGDGVILVAPVSILRTTRSNPQVIFLMTVSFFLFSLLIVMGLEMGIGVTIKRALGKR